MGLEVSLKLSLIQTKKFITLISKTFKMSFIRTVLFKMTIKIVSGFDHLDSFSCKTFFSKLWKNIKDYDLICKFSEKIISGEK